MPSGHFFRGIQSYSKAIRFIQKHRLYRYLILPGILGLLFFLVLFILLLKLVPMLMDGLIGFLPDFMQSGFFHFLGSSLLWIITLIISFITTKYVILIILSPVMSHISEVTEEALMGKKVPSPGIMGILKDIIRSLRINLRNFFWEMASCLFLTSIPVLNFAAPVTVIFTQSYFAGFNLIDFTLERKRMQVKDSVQFMRNHRGLGMGLGIVFYAIMFIPVAGWVVAPLLGTVASTLEVLKVLQEESEPGSDSYRINPAQ